MKPLEIKPKWGLWLGFVIAPVVGALNFTLIDAWHSGFRSEMVFNALLVCALTAFVTGIQGMLTTGLTEVWRDGNHLAARGASLFFGMLFLWFWFWALSAMGINAVWGTRDGDGAPIFGALLLPFLWSLMFLLFPFFARPPKS